MKPDLFCLFVCISLIICCHSTKELQKKLSPEERSVYELVDKLKIAPGNDEAADSLKTIFSQLVSDKRQLTINSFAEGTPGDRWLKLAGEFEKLQKLESTIQAVPAAAKAVPANPNLFRRIAEYRENAAREFYNTGLQYLNYSNRPYAKKAVDMFMKADATVKDYKDVNSLLSQAREMATLKVIVQPVDYFRYSWSYWGFQNDWLQQRMIQDLNFMSFSDVQFYSEWEAHSKRIQADRLVSMRLVDMYIGNVKTENYTYQRSAQVESGATTKSIPPRPVYKTVYATVRVTKKTMISRSDLECRIYSTTGNYTVLNDRYPGNYSWEHATATYTGDKRALTQEDWRLINNRFPNVPGRTEIAEKIIRQSYDLLLSRIRSGVNFGD